MKIALNRPKTTSVIPRKNRLAFIITFSRYTSASASTVMRTIVSTA